MPTSSTGNTPTPCYSGDRSVNAFFIEERIQTHQSLWLFTFAYATINNVDEEDGGHFCSTLTADTKSNLYDNISASPSLCLSVCLCLPRMRTEKGMGPAAKHPTFLCHGNHNNGNKFGLAEKLMQTGQLQSRRR